VNEQPHKRCRHTANYKHSLLACRLTLLYCSFCQYLSMSPRWRTQNTWYGNFRTATKLVIPAKAFARDYGITGVRLSVRLFVCYPGFVSCKKKNRNAKNMASAGARAYMEVWGGAPSGVQGQSPWSGGQGAKPPEAEGILLPKRANLSLSFK